MRNITLLLSVIAAVAVISTASVNDAYAHGTYSKEITMSNGESRTFQLVVGHTSEPAFGNEPGTHDGKHNVDIRIRDMDTKLTISGAQLTLDRYYFEDAKQVDKASTPEDAKDVETNVPVSGIFGSPGSYTVRQLVEPGIYGYHIYGNVKYFDGVSYPVDFTAFCSDGAKFNSVGFAGSYGCVEDIKDIQFPKNGHHSSSFNDKDNKQNNKDNKKGD